MNTALKYLLGGLLVCIPVSFAFAHGVTLGDQGYIQGLSGSHVTAFIYLGAKHMVTGYDHLLFLVGVIFYLTRFSHIAVYVSLFAVGHSCTLLLGAYFNIAANAYLIDAIIGFSIVYKALDNQGAFIAWFNKRPDPKMMTLVFGLFHGLGLATKIQDFELSTDGLLINLIAFNVGVELGQILALCGILIMMGYWRLRAGFYAQAHTANTVLMSAGFLLMAYQLTGYFTA